MTHRNSTFPIVAVLTAVAALSLTACRFEADAAEPPRHPAPTAGTAAASTGADAATVAEAVERGRYLVTVAGCSDCHTPLKMGPQGPEPDMTRFLSGHPEEEVVAAAPVLEGPFLWAGTGSNTAFAGPWGVSFAVNLTPDPNTGIGTWDEAIFANTLRSGRHWGVARPILPPMPWQNYAQMTDADLAAVFAFLRTVAPVHNRVAEPLPPAEAAVPTAGS